MKGFMGITRHFVCDWVLESVMIACKRFKGKHSYDNIRHEYEEAMASFDVENKVTTVINDNASNMIKAFNFSIPGCDKSISTIAADCNDNDDKDEQCDDTPAYDLLPEDCFPNHQRCYAHTLQLVVKDGLLQCGSHIKKVLAKVSNLVNYVRKSQHASELLEDENRLQTAAVTRWNSQLYMIRSVLKVPEDKLNLVDSVLKLSSYERKLLHELCSILEPFERATMHVQQQNNLSASLTVPITLGLKHQVDKISCD